MKTYLSLLVISAFASAQAEVDWSKVTPIYIEFEEDHLSNLPRSSDSLLRIVGGNESIPHSRPYMVGLHVPVSQATSFCGGSLITRQTVLTAAHCFDGGTAPFEVILGAHNISQNEDTQRRLQTSTVIIHPKWDRRKYLNDIALVILPESVTLNANIQLVQLPQRGSNNNYVNEEAVAIGWGRTTDNLPYVNSPVLREVTIPIITNSECYVYYQGTAEIVDSHICASGQGGKSSCFGDSGGPLIVNGVQVGIISFGTIQGCEIGWPSAYSRITSFNDWIHQNQV